MLICVTNRKICKENFLDKIKYACRKANILILREKDLSEDEYLTLAEKVKKICAENDCKFYVNTFVNAAEKIHADGLQLSFTDFLKYTENKDQKIFNVGCSVHSVKEAQSACSKGAKFLICGHIYPTDCKKGLKPRGIDFLKDIIEISTVPVYAIGGINMKNYPQIISAGAKGGCIMSGFMLEKI